MTEIGYYRYEGFDLRTKFGWINGAIGVQATEPARIGMGNLGNAFTESDDTVRGLLSPLGLEWRGQAADTAALALHQAAERGGAAGAANGIGSSAVDGYGQSFEAMRPKIAWQDPGSWDWWEMPVDAYGFGLKVVFGDTFDVQSDFMATNEENRTLEARADEALYVHEQMSRETLAGFPPIAPASAPVIDQAGGYGAGANGGLGPAGTYGNGTRFSSALPDPVGAGASLGPAATGVAAGPTGNGTWGAPTPAGRPAPGRLPTDSPGGPGALGPGTAGPGPGAFSPGRTGPGTAAAPGTTGPGAAAPGTTGPGPVAPSSTAPGTSWPGAARPGTSWPGAAGPGSTRGPGSSTELPGGGPGRRSPGPVWGGAPPAGSAPVGGPGRLGGVGPSAPGGHLGRGGPSGELGGRFATGTEQPAAGQRPAPTAAGTPAGSARGPGATGSPMPFMGGMGAGAGSGSTEHKTRYWIPSTEAFDVELPPHTEPVIEGRDE